MKLSLRVWLPLLLSFSLVPTVGWSADLKVGVVNVVKLLENAPQAERARRDLEREFKPRDDRLLAETKEIKALEDKLAKGGVGDAEARRIERDLIDRKREARRKQDELREDFSLRRNEALSKLQKDISEAINSLARDEGYDLILTDGIAFVRDSLDVTDKIQSRLRASGGATAPSRSGPKVTR